MSELKVYRDPQEGPCWREFYEKSEADKVIADKDKEIAELKDKLRHYPMMAALIESGNKEIAELKDKIAEKYKEAKNGND